MTRNTVKTGASPFYLGSYKTCPMCEQTFPTTVEEGAEHWYLKWAERTIDTGERDVDGDPIFERRMIRIPSSYCKACEKKRVTESRKLRREVAEIPPWDRADLAPFLGGPCDCCGVTKQIDGRRKIVHAHRAFLLCHACRRYAMLAEMDEREARGAWMIFYKHNAHELRLDDEWRQHHDRPREWHTGYDVDPLLPPFHRTCVKDMVMWKNVMRWLERTRDGSGGLYVVT